LAKNRGRTAANFFQHIIFWYSRFSVILQNFRSAGNNATWVLLEFVVFNSIHSQPTTIQRTTIQRTTIQRTTIQRTTIQRTTIQRLPTKVLYHIYCYNTVVFGIAKLFIVGYGENFKVEFVILGKRY
jgi:hypothetical protein